MTPTGNIMTTHSRLNIYDGVRSRRIVTRSWASHVTSRSLSGSPGRTTRARRLFPPCIPVGCVSTSHSKPWSVKRPPTWTSIGSTEAEPALGSWAARAGGCWGFGFLRFSRRSAAWPGSRC
jgi:hypothetical protein